MLDGTKDVSDFQKEQGERSLLPGRNLKSNRASVALTRFDGIVLAFPLMASTVPKIM